MRGVVVMALAAMLAGGCAHALGYAGANPGAIECTGKGSITGTGTVSVGAGVGGAGLNVFTVQADCGDGFTFKQYNPQPKDK